MMYLIEDANDNEPGFVKATPVRPAVKLYTLGDGDDGTIRIRGDAPIRSVAALCGYEPPLRPDQIERSING